jgi:hypothetical protein
MLEYVPLAQTKAFADSVQSPASSIATSNKIAALLLKQPLSSTRLSNLTFRLHSNVVSFAESRTHRERGEESLTETWVGCGS